MAAIDLIGLLENTADGLPNFLRALSTRAWDAFAPGIEATLANR